MTGRMRDKVVLITGAASGIGLSTAKVLAREGARVVMTDRNVALGEAEVGKIDGEAEFHAQDVTKEDRWIEVIDAIVARHGRLDGLVNNAGVGVQKSIEETTLEEWRFVQAVNVEGVFLGCKHAIKAMKTTGGGSIVNVSSVAGFTGAPMLPAYVASKGAVRLLTKSVATYCGHAGYNIRCNSVHPYFMDTPMVDAMVGLARDPEKARGQLAAGSVLKRLGTAEEVANLNLFLLSDESGYCTGAEYLVDGGYTAL